MSENQKEANSLQLKGRHGCRRRVWSQYIIMNTNPRDRHSSSD